MTTLYKLTDKDGYTRRGFRNQCLWGPGVSHSGTGEGELCGPGFIHAYTHPLLAVMLNPIHAAIDNPLLWECAGEIAKDDHGLKVGCVTLTTIRQIDLPVVTLNQRVRFGVMCALAVGTKRTSFYEWAEKWIDGSDRSAKAAVAAERVAATARGEAEWTAMVEKAMTRVEAETAATKEWAAMASLARAARRLEYAEADAAMAVQWAARKRALDLSALAEASVCGD